MSDIYVQPGAVSHSELDNAPTGLVGTLHVQIIRKRDEVVVFERTVEPIIESPVNSGRYVFTFIAPNEQGEYTILWDKGEVSPAQTAADDLVVTHSVADTVEGEPGKILSVEQYKALRGITDTKRDAQIAAALPSVEDAIVRYIERDVLSDLVTEERKYRYEGPIVNIDDAAEIEEVKIGTAVLVRDEQFIAEPYDRSQPYFWLDLGPYTLRRASPEMGFMRNEDVLGTSTFRFVTVKAEWGWATIPPALKLAVAMFVDEVAGANARERGISAEAVADTSVVYEAPESGMSPPVLPPAVEEIVNPFRKIVL